MPNDALWPVLSLLATPAATLWMDVAARGLLAAAHFAGLMALLHLIRHRLDAPFSALFVWISVFIIADSTGLLLDLAAHWQTFPLLKSAWDVVVSLLSVGLMLAMASLLPRTLEAGAVAAFLQRQTIQRLESEVAKRTAELAREKAFVERLIEHLPAGLAFLDRELIIRRINPAYLGYLNDVRTQYLHRPFFERTPEAGESFGPVVAEVLATGEAFTAHGFPSERIVDGKARTHYWDFSYVPVMAEQGEVEGILVFVTDATARVEKDRLQREQIVRLQEVDRCKDEFLSVISHELRTPLTFIMGFASLMQEEFVDPLSPQQRKQVASILLGAERMLQLVEDLLEFAKLRAGKLALEPMALAVSPIVDEVLATLGPLAAERALTLRADVQVPGLITVDRRRLVQVLSNLVGNAIKFTLSGHITVRGYTQGGLVVIEVSDTGPGIAPEDLPRLFQRFQQLDMGDTRAVGGTGLGLAIVKELVEAHGGKVGVRSELGAGTTFWLMLPTARVDAGPGPALERR